jgi:hypothetical protein
MGQKMIALTQVMPYEGDFKPGTRGYMSCTPKTAPGYKDGSVTLLYINTNPTNSSILMYQQSRVNVEQQQRSHAGMDVEADPWGPTPPPFPLLPRTEYVMTPQDAKLGVLSRDVKLNGKPLALVEGAHLLPPIASLGAAGSEANFVVPGQSYGFAVYPEAAAPACMGTK